MRASRPAPSRTMRPYARASGGSNERTVAAAPAARCVASSARDGLRAERRHVAVEHEHVAADGAELRLRAAHGVAGAERLLLHGDVEPVERARAVGRGDDDDPLDACVLRGRDHPVDHPPAEQRVQVLRRRALHARAEAAGHHDCCEIVCHVSEEWLGRQDSNLGSRDQNPLPYHLATPHQGSKSYRRSMKKKKRATSAKMQTKTIASRSTMNARMAATTASELRDARRSRTSGGTCPSASAGRRTRRARLATDRRGRSP